MNIVKWFFNVVFIGVFSIFLYEFIYKDHQKKSKIDDVLALVDTKYVDPVNVDELQKVALEAIFNHLDPHSTYLEPQQVKARNEDLQGSFFGIGVRYSIIRDSLVVTGIVPNGPAAKADLSIGDRIVQVDSIRLTPQLLATDSIQKFLKGPENSMVNLTVFRKRDNTTLTTQIQRGAVDVPTVDAYYMLDKTTGYLRMNMFGEDTDQEFFKTIALLLQQDAEKIVLDLRDNGGGYLKVVLSILEELLPEKKLILYTEGKHSPKESFYTQRTGLLEGLPLVVLINQNTASASEILSGTLQDYDRAVIIGRRSFGKGLVQAPFSRKDGSEVLLTIAKYYIPSGRCVQKPYAHKDHEGYYKDDILARINSGELYDAKKVPKDPKAMFYTENGRKVYGGGGIIPDIFVPLPKQNDALIDSLLAKRTLINFAFLHAEKLGFQLPYQSYEALRDNFKIDETTFADFINFAKQEKQTLPFFLKESQKEQIKHWIKAFVLLHIFQNEEFYFERFLAEEDEMLHESIKAFENYNTILTQRT